MNRALTISLLAFLSIPHASAQTTTVYMRSSGPRGFQVTGVVNGTPPTITTSTVHGLSIGNKVGLWGSCTGAALDPASARSPVNGIFIVASVPTPTTFTINDLSSSPIVGNGDSVSCHAISGFKDSSVFGGKLTGFLLPTGPVGFLDGDNGPTTRKLALGTFNGLTSLVVSGGNLATVTTSYAHLMTSGDKISVTGSGNTNLDHANGQSVTGPYAPYPVTVTDSTHFTFPTSGVSNGHYEGVNNACGPTATPNDLIGGTQDCLRISQLGYTGNTFWDNIVASTDYTVGGTKPNAYKFAVDGGDQFPGCCSYDFGYIFGEGAFRFLVDQSNTTLAAVLAYFMNNVEKAAGVNLMCDTQTNACGQDDFLGNGDEFFTGMSEVAMVYKTYMSSARLGVFWDKVYNDVDDATRSPSSTADADYGKDSHNKVINSGRVASGTNDATHVTLAASASASNNFYVNNIVGFKYVASISAIVPGAHFVTITTSTPWGFAGPLGEFQVYLTGITGTGTCSQMNAEWQITNGLTVIDDHNFIIAFDTALGAGCTGPTGGTSTSWQLCRTGGTTPCYGLITAYDGTTKVATVAGGFNYNIGFSGPGSITPNTDMTYYVYQSMSINTTSYSDLLIDGTTNTKVTSAAHPFTSAMVGNSINVLNGPGFIVQTVNILSVTGVTATVNTSLGTLGSGSGVGVLGGPKGLSTVTGYNTHFTTDLTVGDAIFGANGWDYVGGFPDEAMSFVNTITDDTHLIVLNSTFISATNTPSLAWFVPKWKTGDVGFNWEQKFWQAQPGSQSVAYPPAGGSGVGYSYGVATGSNNGIKNGFGHFNLGITAASTDTRGRDDAARHQTYTWDYELQHYMNYSSGPLHSGGVYSNGVLYGLGLMMRAYTDSLVGFPSIDLTWLMNGPLWKIFTVYPDLRSSSASLFGTSMGYAAETGDANIGPSTPAALGFLLDPIFAVAPNSDQAKWLRYWFQHATDLDIWSGSVASVNYNTPIALIHNDPRTASVSYMGIPLQYAFLKTSSAACSALTGWPCPSSISGNSVVSRTSWTDRTASLVFAGYRSYYNDHDNPQNGSTWIYKVGGLINGDAPPGLYTTGGYDMTMNGDMLRFGGAINLKPGPDSSLVGGLPQTADSPITQWASSNHGSWDSQFGDQSSKFMHVCADVSTAYTFSVDYAIRCVTHFKDLALNGSTGEDIVLQWNSVSLASNPAQVETHIHYVQNGQPAYGGGSSGFYAEGNTTCPGGCQNLDTNRLMQSLENGDGPDAGSNNPQRNYGVISTVLSPGTITMRDDSLPVTVSSVVKQGTVSITTLTPGFPTVVQTSGSHNAVLGEPVTISGVAGTGTCNGTNIIVAVPDSTHYSIFLDTSSCSGPTGGTSSTPTRFNATSHGLFTTAVISSISIANPAQITTATAHGLIEGQFVQLFGIQSTGCSGINPGGLNDQINTAWTVHVVNSTNFTIGFSTLSCGTPSGGHTFTDYNHTVAILSSTGDWAGVNTTGTGYSNPWIIWPVDANTFSLYATSDPNIAFPNTSAYTGSFNGNVNGEYFGGKGWSHRVSVCGGSPCGTTVSNFEALIIHKIAKNLSDTILTAAQITALIGDTNWMSVQTPDKVALFARGGVLHSSIPNFTTTHSGTAQYLFAGLLPGSYVVTKGGSPVAGSPFTVSSSNDATIAFESTAGAIVVAGTPSGCHITTSSLPGGLVGSAYSQTPATSGCTTPANWITVAGYMCLGLTLDNATGVISGTPTNTGICKFTVATTDAAPTTVNQALSITITSGPSLVLSPTSLSFSCVVGGSDPAGQGVSISATGVTLNNWSATKTQSWLAALSPASGSAAGTITVSTTGCGGLSAADYSDTITVASTTSTIVNSPQLVFVTLHVTSPGGGTIITNPRGGKISSGGIIKQ